MSSNSIASEAVRLPERSNLPTVELSVDGRVALNRRGWASSLEDGGWLFGEVLDDRLVIHDCTSSGSLPSTRSEFACETDYDYRELCEQRHAASTGWVWLGAWHSHTRPLRGAPNASPADLRCFVVGHHRMGGSRAFVGLIVFPAAGWWVRGRWDNPVLWAFVLDRRDGEIEIDIQRVVSDAPPAWRI